MTERARRGAGGAARRLRPDVDGRPLEIEDDREGPRDLGASDLDAERPRGLSAACKGEHTKSANTAVAVITASRRTWDRRR